MFAYVGGKYRQAKWISKYLPKTLTDTRKYSAVQCGHTSTEI